MSVVRMDPPRVARTTAEGFAPCGVATVHEAQGRKGLPASHRRPVRPRARLKAGGLRLDIYGMREALAGTGLRCGDAGGG